MTWPDGIVEKAARALAPYDEDYTDRMARAVLDAIADDVVPRAEYERLQAERDAIAKGYKEYADRAEAELERAQQDALDYESLAGWFMKKADHQTDLAEQLRRDLERTEHKLGMVEQRERECIESINFYEREMTEERRYDGLYGFKRRVTEWERLP